MKRSFEIADLIVDYIKGEILWEDLNKLEHWIGESEDNRKLFVSLMDETLFQNELAKHKTDNLDKVFSAIKKQKNPFNKYRQRHWLSGMAAMLVIALGIYWYTGWKATAPLVEQEQSNISIGEHKAWLHLASGERIELNTAEKDTVTFKDHGHQVILNNGRIQIIDSSAEPAVKDMYHMMEVPRGAEYNLVLADGTKVWLNADSRLKFPSRFNGKKRYVELSGEAYFQVSKDRNKPFIVHSNEVDVTVLGTEFCISDYAGKPALATLVEGSVEVMDKEGWKAVLKPGQQAVIEETGSSVKEVEPLYYTAWKDGYFIFENATLQEIMDKLSLWYNCHYFFENQSSAELRLTARLKKYDEIHVLLNILSKTNEIKFKTKGNTILIGKNKAMEK